ncbi:uncharacterized protein LOC127252722 isoform X2 [Andrographis paniculata]|nr:uncharacterized protein LOC127252722 isoform X2 [Andrographis paniculata]
MKEKSATVMDGSDLKKLVENDNVLTNFVDHKFQELDADRDGQLSVKELQPAVADIGAALGLPPKGNSSEADHIYTEVLNEFTENGKERKTSKSKFKEVLSDILLGMASGLERDPVVILRMDGDDLHEFLTCPAFEPELLSIYSEMQQQETTLSGTTLKDYIVNAFEKLTVDQGMPPATDPWVKNNLVEPSMEFLEDEDVSQGAFLAGFSRAAERLARRLKEQPATVAHSQNVFDGSGIKRLLSNKAELDQAMESALQQVSSKERHGKVSKDYLGVALDSLAASASLPPLGAVHQ